MCRSGKTNLCGAVRQWTGKGVMQSDNKPRFSYEGKPIYHFVSLMPYAVLAVLHQHVITCVTVHVGQLSWVVLLTCQSAVCDASSAPAMVKSQLTVKQLCVQPGGIKHAASPFQSQWCPAPYRLHVVQAVLIVFSLLSLDYVHMHCQSTCAALLLQMGTSTFSEYIGPLTVTIMSCPFQTGCGAMCA